MPYIASILHIFHVGEEVETASNRARENIVQSGNSKCISAVMEFSWSSGLAAYSPGTSPLRYDGISDLSRSPSGR